MSVLPVALAALVSLLVACPRQGEHAERERELRAGVAAVVNGEDIALSDVQQLASMAALPPREALRRLIAERLLAQHAAARGYDDSPTLSRELQRARVRALLEQEIESQIPEREVAARAERLARWLDTLRKRAQVKYDEAAIARAFAESAGTPRP